MLGKETTKSGKSKKRLAQGEVVDTNFVNRWSTACQEAFLTLKEKLTSAPILGFPDFNQPFIVEVDASFKGLGAIISQ